MAEMESSKCDSSPENDKSVNIENDTFIDKWGFDLEELYKLALQFYKEKEGKAMHLSYKDRLQLAALSKQVHHGSYRPDISPQVGFLDVVGNDRRQAWQSLGDMPREKCMSEFVRQLDALCTLLKPYVQAHKTEKEDQEQKRREEEERIIREEEEKARIRLEEEARDRQQFQQSRYQQQETQIRAALNQQTAIQFKQYAQQQHPSSPEQQETLIKQLQEQHFQQYMQQVYQQQLLHQQQQYQQLQAMAESQQSRPLNSHPPLPVVNHLSNGGDPPSSAATMVSYGTEAVANGLPSSDTATTGVTNGNGQVVDHHRQSDHLDGEKARGEEEEEEGDDENWASSIAAPSMWTRKDCKGFKQAIHKDQDSVIKIGSGETVTIRVPTHENGTCLFWEFATDSYDIGFGVYFEWTISPSNQVSVHVSESSDEEELEEEEGAGSEGGGKGDIEKGAKKDNRPPTDEIIPVYRRDCHEEVYCGSHMYPGQGVYLLKFDNSYSLWRSKTLYYRVYYTR